MLLFVVMYRTRKDVVMPLAWPIKSADGKSELKEIPVPRNTNIIISILNTNRSERIWGDDAKEWKPERWLLPLPDAVSEARIPGVYSNLSVYLFCIVGLRLTETWRRSGAE